MSEPSRHHDHATTDQAMTEAHIQRSEDNMASMIGVPILESFDTTTPSQNMPAPQSFISGDLAMETNTATNAPAPPIGLVSAIRNPAITTVSTEAPAGSTPVCESSADPTPSPATSATGWLVPPAAASTSRITFEVEPEYLSLSEITFEWGDSYDDKDWMRLRAILAPTLMIDYTKVNGHKWDSMPASDFVDIMSHIGFVGDPLVHTQHHIGASKWQKISDEEVIGHHQLHAAHQRYTRPDLNEVENKGHGHAMVQHFYRRVDGEWKLAGLRPRVRWNEFEFEKIFKGF